MAKNTWLDELCVHHCGYFLLKNIFFREEDALAIRVLRQELDTARSDQASALQRSVNQQSSFNSIMSTAIEDIRAEHAETLKDREEQIKVTFNF